jgi:hypothetical protein
MMIRMVRVCFAVVVAAAAGCGSSYNGAASADALAAGFTEAFCTLQLRCCSALEISALGGRYATPEACMGSSVAREVELQLAIAGPSFERGRMTIDWRRASECLQKYAARACSSPRMVSPGIVTPSVADLLASCPGMLVGHVNAGERCDLEGECVAGARCFFPGSNPGLPLPPNQGPLTAPGGGICVPHRKQGETCVSHADCDPAMNLVCHSTDRLCGPAAQLGASCGAVFPSAAPDECDRKARLYCEPSTGQCQRLPGEGEPCSVFGAEPCDTDPTLGLGCIGAGVNGFGTCMRAAGAGASCGAAALPVCGPQLYCRATQSDGIGVCDDLKQLDDACTGGDCAQGSVCDPHLRVCATPGPNPPGSRCEQDSDCVTLSCEAQFSANKVCTPVDQRVECTGGAGGVGAKVQPDGGFFDAGPAFDASTPFDAFPAFDRVFDVGSPGDGGAPEHAGEADGGAARSDGP